MGYEIVNKSNGKKVYVPYKVMLDVLPKRILQKLNGD